MERESAREALVTALARIAPEISIDRADPSADLQDELDLDSMDLLALVTGLAEATGVQVPDSDLGQLSSIESLLDYLVDHSS
jgi:acyl carrier protein